MSRYNGLAFVYSTCTKYLPLANDYFSLFKKFFPDFNGHMYTNVPGEIISNGYSIIGIKGVVKDDSFSSRLIQLLLEIPEDYVLFTLDDLFLTDYVNVPFVEKAYEIIKSDRTVGAIVLHDSPNSDDICKASYNDFFDILNPKAPYRNNTQASIWNKQILLHNLRYGESAWDFELIGSYRSKFYKYKILYRKDSFFNAFNYPRGGVIAKGSLRKGFEEMVSNPFLFRGNLVVKKKKSLLKSIHSRIVSFFYPVVSIFIKKIHRKGYHIPRYIFKHNDCTKIRFLD